MRRENDDAYLPPRKCGEYAALTRLLTAQARMADAERLGIE
jgi:hypothetical protein